MPKAIRDVHSPQPRLDLCGGATVEESHFSDRITERFGAMTCKFNLVASEETLSMEIVGWSLGPMPLPRSLAPTINAREWVDEQGRFRFDVAIGAPVIGQIVHYRGWLLPS